MHRNKVLSIAVATVAVVAVACGAAIASAPGEDAATVTAIERATGRFDGSETSQQQIDEGLVRVLNKRDITDSKSAVSAIQFDDLQIQIDELMVRAFNYRYGLEPSQPEIDELMVKATSYRYGPEPSQRQIDQLMVHALNAR